MMYRVYAVKFNLFQTEMPKYNRKIEDVFLSSLQMISARAAAC